MPLLQPRPGENDGGYAVADYRAVDPQLGTMDDLERAGRRAARARHERSASTSSSTTPPREHEWARRRGPATRRTAAIYLIFPDRTDAGPYERTLPEVFPDIAPGNFTWHDELGALGVDDVQRATSGTSTGPTPRSSPRCSP